MTSDEIRAAVERLKARHCDSTPAVYSVVGAFMDIDTNGSFNALALRNRLIGLLEMADPETHMELPKDADGVHIHVGDMMCGAVNTDYLKSDKCLTVCALAYNRDGLDRWEWQDEFDEWHVCAWWRHYHKPTVEDVLREFSDEVQRCCDTEDTIAEYAAKLREVMRDE